MSIEGEGRLDILAVEVAQKIVDNISRILNLIIADDTACPISDEHSHCLSKGLACTRQLRAVSAARLPYVVLLVVFEYLSLKDLAQCMRVCKHWWTVLQYSVSFSLFSHQSLFITPLLIISMKHYRTALYGNGWHI